MNKLKKKKIINYKEFTSNTPSSTLAAAKSAKWNWRKNGDNAVSRAVPAIPIPKVVAPPNQPVSQPPTGVKKNP